MYGDLKLTFIENSLRKYLADVRAAMRILIRKNKVGVTEHLIESLADEVVKEAAGATGKLLFDESGRFVDMGVGKAHKLGGLKATRAAFTKKSAAAEPGVRKPKKIYSRVAYGKLNHLMNELLFGFTEETIAILKNEMHNNKN